MDFNETWPGVAPWMRDLLSIDRALGVSQYAPFLRLEALRLARTVKQGMEQDLQLAGKPARPYRVALSISSDHDPPQSDVCLAIKTKPARGRARAWVMLEGPGGGPAASTPLKKLRLNRRGRGKARFPVSSIGVFQFDVGVIAKRGHSVFKSRAFSNAHPSARRCG